MFEKWNLVSIETISYGGDSPSCMADRSNPLWNNIIGSGYVLNENTRSCWHLKIQKDCLNRKLYTDKCVTFMVTY